MTQCPLDGAKVDVSVVDTHRRVSLGKTLVAVTDSDSVSTGWCEGSSHGKLVQAPIRFVILHSVYDSLGSRSTRDRK